MSDHAEFLGEILANPDDVTARLVYADWLEERGDPRSEFIRVQCRLAELSDEDPEYRKLDERSLEFIRKYKEQWVVEIAPLVFSPRLNRGFVEEIVLGCKQFSQHHQRLFELAPIRHVNLLRLSPKWIPELRACDSWRSVRSLDMSNNTLYSQGQRVLLESPHLSSLKTLKLGFGEASFLEAADAPQALLKLQELNITYHKLLYTSAFARWWVGRLPELKTLRFEHCELTGTAMSEMLLHQFPRVRALHLAHNPLGDSGAAALARCPGLDRLETLDLCDTSLGASGIKALAESPYLKKLRRINLSHSRPTPTAMEDLLDVIRPSTLKLNDCQLTDATVTFLASAPNLAGLRVLELEGTPGRKGLTNASALALQKSHYLKNLTMLNLRHCAIDADVQRQLRSHFGVGVCTFSESLKRR